MSLIIIVSGYVLCMCLQLLKHVTIAAGGVLPRIHPELLVRKKGGKMLNVVTPPKMKKAASVAAAKAADLLKPSTTATADKGKKKAGKKLKVTTVSNLQQQLQIRERKRQGRNSK